MSTGEAGPGHGYTERLWPSAGTWAVVPLAGLGAALSLVPFGPAVAAAAAAVVMALSVTGFVLASPVVAVQDGQLRAGAAHIPVRLLGTVEPFSGDEARHQRGPALDARAYLLLRGWVAPVLRVPILDPQDPTPYWLVSTRRPEALREAIIAAQHLSAQH